MTRYGSDKVSFFLINGLNVVGTLTEFDQRLEAKTEETHGLGDAWAEHTFIGVRDAEIQQSGFYDDAAGSANDALSSGPGSSAVLCYSLEGTASGAGFVAWSGGLQINYQRGPEKDALTKAKAGYKLGAGGLIEQGKTIWPYKQVAATGLSSGAAVDHGACSTGGAGYLQYNATAGECIVRLKQSPDGNSWADLFEFSKTASGHGAQRMATTGVIQRYTAVDFTTATATGSVGDLYAFVGLVRTATATGGS